jgi:hypothetical protein
MCFQVSDLIPSPPICYQNFLIFLLVSHSIRFYSYLLIWKVSTMNTKSDVLFWKLVENELSSLNASTRSIHHRPIWPWLPWIKRMIDGLYSLIHQSLFPSNIQARFLIPLNQLDSPWRSDFPTAHHQPAFLMQPTKCPVYVISTESIRVLAWPETRKVIPSMAGFGS